jgi:hypothetical protein
LVLDSVLGLGFGLGLGFFSRFIYRSSHSKEDEFMTLDGFGLKKTLFDEPSHGRISATTKKNEERIRKKKQDQPDDTESTERSKKRLKQNLSEAKKPRPSAGLFDDDPFASVSRW